VNRPWNEFVWVTTYKDEREMEAKNQEFQAAVAGVGVKRGGDVAKLTLCFGLRCSGNKSLTHARP
jgi:hypothetical protein